MQRVNGDSYAKLKISHLPRQLDCEDKKTIDGTISSAGEGEINIVLNTDMVVLMDLADLSINVLLNYQINQVTECDNSSKIVFKEPLNGITDSSIFIIIDKAQYDEVSFNESSLNFDAGDYSHSEGQCTVAIGTASHAEGGSPYVYSYNVAITSVDDTTINGDFSEIKNADIISVPCSLIITSNIGASVVYATKLETDHIEIDKNIGTFEQLGNSITITYGTTTASGDYGSHAEGGSTTASGNYSHAEGYYTTAQNAYEHAQGKYNKSNTGTSDDQKTIHSIGIGTSETTKKNAVEVMTNGDVYVNGIGGYDGTNYSSAKTLQEVTSGRVGMVDANSNGTGEIFNTYSGDFMNKATGNYSHAEGWGTTASGSYSHAEGLNTTASGERSHAEGGSTTASGDYGSHAEGWGTTAAAYCQHVQGKYNTIFSSESPTTYSATTRAFIIGNGTTDSAIGDAFYVLFNGETHADGAFTNDGADYAEMFEWSDGNTNKEDRVGHFVTLDNDKIRIANSDDNYILGIVSGSPMVIGNNPMRWQGKFINDKWGRPVYENIEYDEQVPMTPDDEGYDPESKEPQMKIVKRQAYVRKQNPEWNGEQEYSLRTSRDEWACVGLMGQLLVRQDGTLKAGGFCKVSDSGVATNSDSGYYVMKVNSDSQALVMFK